MKKYTTKPIDFTSCHPVIAECLKRGEMIECWVWDCEDSPCQLRKKWVCSYSKEESCSYISTEGIVWRYAEPVPIKAKIKRIMPPEQAIPMLIAEGWSFDDSGNLVGCGISVMTSMFKLMGKPLSDPKTSVYAWPFCIIEEVEDDE